MSVNCWRVFVLAVVAGGMAWFWFFWWMWGG